MFNHKTLSFPLIALHALFKHCFENAVESVGYLFDWLLLEFLDVTDNFVVSALSDLLKLRVKAVKQLSHDLLNQFLLNFVEDILIVLLGRVFEVITGLSHDARACLIEVLNYSHIALCCQCLNLLLNPGERLVFDLIAAVVGDHFSLAWQIELFLLSDHGPSLLDKDWQTVNWYILRFGTMVDKKSV